MACIFKIKKEAIMPRKQLKYFKDPNEFSQWLEKRRMRRAFFMTFGGLVIFGGCIVFAGVFQPSGVLYHILLFLATIISGVSIIVGMTKLKKLGFFHP